MAEQTVAQYLENLKMRAKKFGELHQKELDKLKESNG